jgi:hypothetical protein
MAWRPTRFLIEGMLDNTCPKKVRGWMKFVGVKRKVTFDLEGDFHRDIRGAIICFTGDAEGNIKEAREYMKGFAMYQTGKVGDMTAGLPPRDYVDYCYLEWFSKENGRIVIELDQDKIKLATKPIPASKTEPISRDEQTRNMVEFLAGLAKAVNIPAKKAVCISGNTVTRDSKKEVKE